MLELDKSKLEDPNFEGDTVIKGGVARKLVDNHEWSDRGVGILFVFISVGLLSGALVALVEVLKRVMKGKASKWLAKVSFPYFLFETRCNLTKLMLKIYYRFSHGIHMLQCLLVR